MLTLALALTVATTEVETRRFAIVVGVNRSDHESLPALRYADDDAVAMAQLLSLAGVESQLLVDLDDDSRRLHRGVVPSGAPTHDQVLAAVRRAHEQLRAARAAGHATEFLFVYSGHGDVDHGEGYVVLADGRLTRSELYQQVLEPSPADHNHVVVDACKSYYLAFAKGPGGQRAPFPRGFAGTTADVASRTGFVLSTSSDRDSHEWERFQAGVFSYQVRSALRGAADVDADGRVTYTELGAFLTVASALIENARFRPDFVVRSPANALGDPLVSWPATTETLTLGDSGWGHLYVENGAGERLFDAHPRTGEHVVLHLPGDRPLFVRRQQPAAEWVIAAAGSTSDGKLAAAPVSVAIRGAEHLAFEALFAAPFGRADVNGYAQVVARQADPIAGAQPTNAVASPGLSPFVFAGIASTAVGGLALIGGVACNLVALERYLGAQQASQQERAERNNLIATLNLASIVAYTVGAVGVSTGALTLLWPVAESAP